jgi:hypothetical protein
MQQAAQIGEEDDSSPIAGHSAAMAEVRNRIRSGPGPIPRNGGLPCLTIMGPPSSGRRTMAAALLASWWPAPMPHVWFDATACEHDAAIAGLTESLARAAGGVLVVIGPEHLPPAAQALLGQACAPLLGSSEPDRDRRTNLVFVMAADPRQASSLHHRLRQHLTARCVGIPPLRDRPEDIAPILRRILRHRWNRRIDLTPDALLTLAAHPWPGGTAELSVVADRLIELPEGVAVGSYQISSALVA